MYDFILFCNSNYSSYTLYHYRVIWSWGMSWPWGVTQDHWKWQDSIDRVWVPVDFQCNYGYVLYRFRDKAKYWSKIAIISYPLLLNNPLGETVANSFAVFFYNRAFQWPLTLISRSRYYCTSNNSQTVQDRSIVTMAD